MILEFEMENKKDFTWRKNKCLCYTEDFEKDVQN